MNRQVYVLKKYCIPWFVHQLQPERNRRRNQYLSEPGGASVGETAGEGVWLNTVPTVQHGRDVLDNSHVKCTNADNLVTSLLTTRACVWCVCFLFYFIFLLSGRGGGLCVQSASVLAAASQR